jgi:hypothetical protein
MRFRVNNDFFIGSFAEYNLNHFSYKNSSVLQGADKINMRGLKFGITLGSYL